MNGEAMGLVLKKSRNVIQIAQLVTDHAEQNNFLKCMLRAAIGCFTDLKILFKLAQIIVGLSVSLT